MTRRQLNKFSMYRAVNEVLSGNETSLTAIKALYDTSKNFEQLFSTIEEIDRTKSTVSKGITIEKDNAGLELANSLVKISAVLFAYGKKTKNENMKSISKIKLYELKRMRITNFIKNAKNILKYAKPVLQQMKELNGEIEEEYKIAETNLISYENSLNNKEYKTTERISAISSLSKEFQKADIMLKEDLDTLIELIKDKYPDIYRQYKAARVIKDLGVRKKKDSNAKSA